MLFVDLPLTSSFSVAPLSSSKSNKKISFATMHFGSSCNFNLPLFYDDKL
ncbi:hypothetical protein Lalb_Chr03g0039901 [Lupinus albus]|uniref:Uncharacterized protein n=1 Tax=Lupinus albus TaxID=3870 RepID=A0A6A4QY13_LUPAL|nr:hypothetical protein Lalb_Chr03g0039901 [Lupinus albus]